MSDHPTTAAFSYWLVSYRRVWRSSVSSSFVIPLLWLAAIGYGVGGFIDRGGSGLGVSYLEYLAPGLLASVIINTAAGECTWPVHGAIRWNKQYLAMLASPLRVSDVLLGHLEFVTVRLLLTAGAFFVAMALFGVIRSAWAPAAVAAAVLTGLAVATPVYTFAAKVEHESRFPVLYRFGVVPLMLFSGVFFPIQQLPAVLQPLAWLSPVWHGAELCRAAMLGAAAPLSAAMLVTHLGFLVLCAAAGLVAAQRALTRRLVK
ncbi:MAG: ABC transporter permease [Micromonosporaceae bacterium]